MHTIYIEKRSGESSKVREKKLSHLQKHIDSDSDICLSLVMMTFRKYLSHCKPMENKEEKLPRDRCC